MGDIKDLFNPGDTVTTRTLPKKTGTVLCKVEGSYYYYVLIDSWTWSYPSHQLMRIRRYQNKPGGDEALKKAAFQRKVTRV